MNRSRRRRNKHLLLSGNYFRNITVNKVFGLRELALDRHAWGVEEQFLLLLFSCPVVSEEQRNRKKKKAHMSSDSLPSEPPGKPLSYVRK